MERYFHGDDQGQDVPRLNHIWSIEGVQHHASVRVPSHRQPQWIRKTTVHLEIFFVCNLNDALPQNPGIAGLHTVPPIRAEFVVIRRTNETVLHALDIRIIDSRKIDVALTKYVPSTKMTSLRLTKHGLPD